VDRKKGWLFVIILGISALLVEVCAAFFSVYGLSKLFAGASTAVILMASSLEIAKVVTASFLYRQWGGINALMKTYLTFGVVVLVVITSMGIYGFLSNAFQSSTLQLEKQTAKISLYENELSRITLDKQNLLLERQGLQTDLSSELNSLVTADTSRRYLDALYRNRVRDKYQPLIKQKDEQLRSIESRVEIINDTLSTLKINIVDTGSDVGPIVYVARFFDTGVSTVVQYLIFVFIGVFDPLAVVLVIATNKAWLDYKHEGKTITSEPKGKKKWSLPFVKRTDVSQPPVIEEPKKPFFEKRVMVATEGPRIKTTTIVQEEDTTPIPQDTIPKAVG
jgi:hypothetical protein